MENILILQGVCVSITDPLPKGERNVLHATMMLDVANISQGKVQTIPVVFRKQQATAVKRDIMPGDIVTVTAVTVEVKTSDGPRYQIFGIEARVQKAVNVGIATGRLLRDPVLVRFRHRGKECTKTSLHLKMLEEKREPVSLHLDVFGNLAEEYCLRFREGMMLNVSYRIQSYEKDGKLRLRLLVTHADQLDKQRRRDWIDEMEEAAEAVSDVLAADRAAQAYAAGGVAPPDDFDAPE